LATKGEGCKHEVQAIVGIDRDNRLVKGQVFLWKPESCSDRGSLPERLQAQEGLAYDRGSRSRRCRALTHDPVGDELDTTPDRPAAFGLGEQRLHGHRGHLR
jgi:hypothetical protein